MLSSLLTFLAVLSALVVVHEFGHYLVARWVGIRVERFSIGFGPVVFGRRFGQTEFVFSLLPFGGFVKMAGESPDEAGGHPWEFTAKPAWQRLCVVLAGPVMNAVLAVVLFFAVFTAGQPVLTSQVGRVLEGAPAAEAGVRPGDRIVSIDGRPTRTWDDVLAAVQASDGSLAVALEDASGRRQVDIRPRLEPLRGPGSKERSVPFIGVAPSSEVFYVRHAPWEAAGMAVGRVWTMTGLIVQSLALLVTGALPFKESLTGPIGIFYLTREAAGMGLVYLLNFTATLSVSLFVLNLLPLPVLDGGHVLFIAIERLKGSPLKDSTKERMTQAGLVVILALMAFVVFQDVQRFALLDGLKKFFVK